MSDKSAEETADVDEGGVRERRAWTTPTITEHRGLAVENGVVDGAYKEGAFYSTGIS